MTLEQARKLVEQALELRLSRRPVSLDSLVRIARAEPQFARAWLAHAIASDASPVELAAALALSAGHGLSEISLLRELWAGLEQGSATSLRQRFSAAAPHGLRWPERNSAVVLAVAALDDSRKPAIESATVTRHALPLPVRWLDWLRDFARARLQPASVYGQEINQDQKQIRDSDQAVMPTPTTDPVLASIERLMAHCADAPIERAEPLVALRYRPGQQYRWHRDYIQPTGESVRRELAFFGQRVHTGILYLNNSFEGGATEFRDWALSLRPEAGTVLGFPSVHPDGSPDPSSVHRGAPVETGEKWIATLWFRDRPIWTRRGLTCDG